MELMHDGPKVGLPASILALFLLGTQLVQSRYGRWLALGRGSNATLAGNGSVCHGDFLLDHKGRTDVNRCPFFPKSVETMGGVKMRKRFQGRPFQRERCYIRLERASNRDISETNALPRVH